VRWQASKLPVHPKKPGARLHLLSQERAREKSENVIIVIAERLAFIQQSHSAGTSINYPPNYSATMKLSSRGISTAAPLLVDRGHIQKILDSPVPYKNEQEIVNAKVSKREKECVDE